jgi:transcriptional regulator of acetoin/glycerol metabolism
VPLEAGRHPQSATDETPARPLDIDSVRAALELSGGNRSQAAIGLGVSRMTLWRKIREFGL